MKIKLLKDETRQFRDGQHTIKKGTQFEVIKKERIGFLVRTEHGNMYIAVRDVAEIETSGTEALNRMFG